MQPFFYFFLKKPGVIIGVDKENQILNFVLYIKIKHEIHEGLQLLMLRDEHPVRIFQMCGRRNCENERMEMKRRDSARGRRGTIVVRMSQKELN